MNEIISIYKNVIAADEVKTVNARHLHEFLEIGKDFSTWIKDRVQQFSFIQNVDFVVVTESGENSIGGRPMKDYMITLDMAKELSMVERSVKGKEARQYFIGCEKLLLEQANTNPHGLPETKLGWMELAVDTERKYQGALALTHQQAEFILEQETEIKELTPKADWVDTYVAASSSILYKFRQVVHLLDTKERIFRAWLVDNKIMYKLNSNWTCYAEYKDLKYFESFVNKSLPHKSDIYFTSKGFEWVSKKWDKHVASQSI